MKFENENFSFEVFIEGTFANANKNLPTGKVSFYHEREYLC